MIDNWYDIPESKRNSIKKLAKYRHWALLHARYSSLIGSESRDHAREIGLWLESCSFKPNKNYEETYAQDEDFIHNKKYWYDAEREVYVLHLPSLKRPFVLRASIWAQMKEAYSNWDGAPSSVNEMARKFGMARNTVREVLKAMDHTHDGPIWTDSTIENTPEDSLVEDLLQRKLQKVVVDAEKKEWFRIKKDAAKWRRLDLLASEIERRFNTNQDYAPPIVDIAEAERPYIAVISPTDYHWGKYAPASTGDEYNRDIARARLFDSTVELLSRIVQRGRPDKIIIALGGDGLHFDTYHKKTTNGTPQDSDGTPEEIAWSWVELCRDYVNMVCQIAPVDLYVIPGNHDRFTSVFLRAAMKGWFSTIDSVTVVETLSPRQYLQYGKNMIGFLHGDIGKVRDWPAIMAGEAPSMWGNASNRFIFTGHFHTERELPTFGNVTVYRMPSLAGTDNWHFNHGYKSRKALVCYIIDEVKGVVATEIEPVL